MENESSEILLEGNIVFFKRFIEAQKSSGHPSRTITMPELFELVKTQLNPVDADIVTRRLLGQELLVIAEQMQIEWEYVRSILSIAPGQINFDSFEFEIVTERDISVKGLSEKLHRSERWIQLHLPYIPYTAVKKYDPLHATVRNYFPSPETETALEALPDDILMLEPPE